MTTSTEYLRSRGLSEEAAIRNAAALDKEMINRGVRARLVRDEARGARVPSFNPVDDEFDRAFHVLAWKGTLA